MCRQTGGSETHAFISGELAGLIGRLRILGRLRTLCSPNCARIFGVLYIVEPLCSTSLEAEAIHVRRHAPITRNFKSIPWGIEYTPPRYWMSNLWVFIIWYYINFYICIDLSILNGVWKGRRIRGDVLSQWIWRVYAAQWHAELHCPRVEGFPHWGRVHHDRTTMPRGWIHHSIGSDYGRSTWEAMPTSLLVEWRYGATCAEGQSSFEGFGTCAGGWPRAHISIFYDRHGYHGLSKEEAHSLCSHIVDTFAKWIGRSTHFNAVPLLLEAGQQHVTAAQERHSVAFGPLNNLLYLYTWVNLWVLDHHNWWVEYPQF